MAHIYLATGLLTTLSLISGGCAAPVSLNIVGRDVALLATYDYIVVRGGTSGLTVADRLTEDADSKTPEPLYLRYSNDNKLTV
jgi:hypothetical protein